MSNVRKELHDLVEKAISFRLPEKDILEAKECIEYGEFECCLEVVVAQLYENNIKVDIELYNLVLIIANLMSLQEENYGYLKELIDSEASAKVIG